MRYRTDDCELLASDIQNNLVKHRMQELELNYPMTKGEVYSSVEDQYQLCRLNHYGMQAEDVYERIKKDIAVFPAFRHIGGGSIPMENISDE